MTNPPSAMHDGAAHSHHNRGMVRAMRSPAMPALRLGLATLCLVLGVTALGACAGAPARPLRVPAETPRRPTTGAPAGPLLPGPPGLPARVIAELPSLDTAVFVARRGDIGLLLAGVDGHWLTRQFDGTIETAAASPPSKPPAGAATIPVAAAQEQAPDLRLQPGTPGTHTAGEAPADASLGALDAIGDGYVALWAKPVEGYHEVWAMGLDATGSPAGSAHQLSRQADPVHWVQILPTSAGALLLWEVARADGSDLLVTPWNAGEPKAEAITVTKTVGGWQATPTSHGVAIGYATCPPSEGIQPRCAVKVVEVDPDGVVAAPVDVASRPTAYSDVQLAALGDRLVLSWTDVGPTHATADKAPPTTPNWTQEDPHVFLAVVAHGGGVVEPPRPAIPPVGAQALISLVAAADGQRALLAWEREVVSTGRLVLLTTVGPDGQTASPRAALEFHGTDDAPHFTVDGDGFATLTLGPTQLSEGASEEMQLVEQGVVAPTFVRFGADLSIRAAEPIRIAELGPPGIPAAMRGLHCGETTCTALASDGAESPRLLLVSLPVRESPWLAPAAELVADGPPRATALTTVAQADQPVGEVATVAVAGGSSLVAWVTHVAGPGAGERRAPKSTEATLGFRFVDGNGRPSDAHELTQRAVSIGGVAVAPIAQTAAFDRSYAKRPGKRPVGAIGWVGPDATGYAQLYVTGVRADGSKWRQHTLTRFPRRARGKKPASELYDVALTADGKGGYVIAWVDTRDGNPEIYAAKVGATLEKRGTDRRITTSDGTSSEVQLAIHGDRVWVVWSDDRDDPAGGKADIYFAQLELSTLKKTGDDKRLFRSPAHSRTPAITTAPGGGLIHWIEEPKSQAEADQAGLRVLRLDALGSSRDVPLLVRPGPDTPVSSAALSCAEQSCRGMLSSPLGTSLYVGAFDLPKRGPARVKAIAELAGGTPQDVSLVSPSAQLDALFFIHDRAGRGAQVRQLHLAW